MRVLKTVKNLIRPATAKRAPGLFTLFTICTLFGLLGFTRSYYLNLRAGLATSLPSSLVDWLACFYPWVFLAPLVFQLEEAFSRSRRHRARFPVLALAAVGIAAIAVVLRLLLLVGTRRLLSPPTLTGQSVGTGLVAEFAAQLFLFFLAYVGAYVRRGLIQRSEHERERDRLALEKSELESSLRQAELETLRTRLNPHFLFNTLQNISVLAEHDPPLASEMLSRLSDLLRAAFRSDFQAEIPLETELELTRAYLDIERIRFGDRLTIAVDLADDTVHALVPALVLQPLVENAIVHGLQFSAAGTIRIQSAIEEERLMLRVIDNGTGLEEETVERLKLGIGLGSVRDRLARMYPGNHEFDLRKGDQGGFEVRFAIPLRFSGPHSRENVNGQLTLADCG